MAAKITEEVKKILNSENSIKVLATVDKEGIPHVAFKNSIHVNEDGYIEYLELIESSRTNKNMVYSIWFGKTVIINVLEGKRSFLIRGIPYRSIIAGREFEKAYCRVQEKKGKIDLGAVWLIEPIEIIEETFEKRRVEEEEAHPILKHLDRLVVES